MITLSAKLTFHIAYANSLKEKRMAARSLMDKTRRKFNVAIAEVDTQDIHRTLTLGLAVVSGENTHAQTMMDEIIRYMENQPDTELISAERI